MDNLKIKLTGKNERRKKWTFVFLFVLLVILDLVSKHFAEGVFRNYDFAFSLRVNSALMFVLYFLGIGYIFWQMLKTWNLQSIKKTFPWFLLLTGAVLNVGERIILGYVRDWIYVQNGIFNLADAYIILGVIGSILISNKKMLNKN